MVGKPIVSFWQKAYFSGVFAVSFREGNLGEIFSFTTRSRFLMSKYPTFEMDFCDKKSVHCLGWLGNILMICCRWFLKDFFVVFYTETWGNLIQFDGHMFFFKWGGKKNSN